MTSIKCYLWHVLIILYGKHIKIFNYHFSLEAWLERKWNNFPNFQEVTHHISFYLPQCLGKLSTCVHYDFCCCVVDPNVCCCHFIPEQITHLSGFNPSAWGHLNPSPYCDVGRLFYGVFKLWSKLQRKKWRNNF